MSKVLIVDDDEDISSAVTLIMQMNGIDCQYILEPNEVYNKLEEMKPDIVIIDVKLKGLDGRHLCKEIKTDKKYSALPVILISADNNISKSIHEYRANAFIPKPFETSYLIKTAQSLIENNQVV